VLKIFVWVVLQASPTSFFTTTPVVVQVRAVVRGRVGRWKDGRHHNAQTAAAATHLSVFISHAAEHQHHHPAAAAAAAAGGGASAETIELVDECRRCGRQSGGGGADAAAARRDSGLIDDDDDECESDVLQVHRARTSAVITD